MLEIQEVDAGYGQMQVLKKINVTVCDGETVALVGSNGVGKTTLINAISGLVNITSGNMSFHGKSISSLSPSERVKMGIIQIPEGRKLFYGMTVNENIEMGAYSIHDDDITRSSLKWVYDLFPELYERRTQLAGTLSGGEQQMVAFGRALMSNPKILLIDEFSLGLAPVIVDRLVDALRKIIKETGVGVFIVEQDVSLGLEISQRAYVLETGKIILHGPASELLMNDQIKDSYLGV